MRELRNNPELIETAVEEFLRVESSNQLGNRRAAKDTALGGIAMPQGTYIHIGIGAANRNPAQFPNPTVLTSGGIPIGILPSVRAFTPAQACHWPEWKPRSPSAGWCSASKASSAPGILSAVAELASGGFCDVRCV